MRIKVIIKLNPRDIVTLDDIGFNGFASNGHRQDFDFCLQKAIDEFIKKYNKKED